MPSPTTARQPPGPSGGAGRTILSYEADRLGFLHRMATEYGDIVRIDDKAWLVNEPRAAQTILQATGRTFAGTRDFLHQRTAGNARDDAVQHISGEMTRALGRWTSGSGLRRMQALVDAAVDELPARDVDPVEVARNVSLGLVSEMCFGPHAPELREPSRELLDALLARMNSPWVLPSRLPTPGNRRVARAHARLRTVLDRRVNDPIGCGPDSIVAVLSRPDLVPGGLSPAAVARWTTSLLLPAQEPPAGALGWVVYELLRQPDWRDRALVEADRRDAVQSDPATVLDHFPVLTAIIYEALRLHPPTWLLVRQSREAADILGYRTTPGQLVYVSPWILHRDPRLFDDPGEFDPRRWLEHDLRRRSLAGFFSYGRGPNRCPGYALNLAFTTLVTATLLRRRELIEVSPGPVESNTKRALLPSRLRLDLPARPAAHRRAS